MSNYLDFYPTEENEYYFISYNNEDAHRISKYVKPLAEKYDVPLWYDFGIPYGDKWEKIIAEKISNCKSVIMFISTEIFRKVNNGRESFVLKEYKMAKKRNKKIIFVMLDCINGFDIPDELLGWSVDIDDDQNIIAYENSTENVVSELFNSIDSLSNSKNNHNEIVLEEPSLEQNNISIEGGWMIYKNNDKNKKIENIDQILLNYFKKKIEKKEEESPLEKKVQEIQQKQAETNYNAIVNFDIVDNSFEFLEEKCSLEYFEEKGYKVDKQVTIKTLDTIITKVYQIDKTIEYESNTFYYNVEQLETTYNKSSGMLTISFDYIKEEGSRIIFLFFDSYGNDNIVYLNNGVVTNDRLVISKRPLCLQCAKEKENNIYNNVAYFDNEMGQKQIDENITIDADLSQNPFVVIDPQNGNLIKREIFYDYESRQKKAKIELEKNKYYFTFQIVSKERYKLNKREIGRCYRKGIYGYPKDISKAVKLLEEDGSPEALYELSLIFNRENIFKDENIYLELLHKSIEKDCQNAIIEYAIYTFFNKGTSEIKVYSDMLKEKLSPDSGVGYFILACMLEKIGSEEAFDFYFMSASRFYPSAVRLQCNSKSVCDKFKEEIKSKYLESLTNKLNLMNYCLGCVLYYGIQIESDKSLGIKALEKGVEKGSLYCLDELSCIYCENEFVANEIKNIDSLKTYMLEQLSLTDTSYCVELANRYIDGIGCEVSEENDKKAMVLLQKAAEDGDNIAENNLGWMYKSGRACDTDYQKAIDLFLSAKVPASYYHLGDMYESGKGVSVDLDKAIEYYKIGAEKGNKKAKERLKVLVEL